MYAIARARLPLTTFARNCTSSGSKGSARQRETVAESDVVCEVVADTVDMSRTSIGFEARGRGVQAPPTPLIRTHTILSRGTSRCQHATLRIDNELRGPGMASKERKPV